MTWLARGGPPLRDIEQGRPLEAWHLPGFQPSDRSAGDDLWQEGATAGGAAFRAPRLAQGDAEAIASTVRTAALTARAERSFDEVVRAVARAACRLADPEDEWGEAALALLGRELAWPRALAAETLAGMAAGWSEDALHDLLRAEFGDPRVLDGFRPDPLRPDRLRRASGPEILFQVHAGNVPGVAVTGVIRALLVRSGVLCKLPEDEPGLVPLFARALTAEDALLGRTLAATWWPGDERTPAWSAWVKRAGKVTVYGGDAAVRAVRRDVPPSTDVAVYGPRIGVAVALADALAGAPEVPADIPASGASVFARLARDICAYEQRGCVSPRFIFVVGHEPEAFGARLARALAEENDRVPAPLLGAAEAVAIRNARTEAELGGAAPEVSGGSSTSAAESSILFASDADLSWTVILHRPPRGVHSDEARVATAADPLPRTAANSLPRIAAEPLPRVAHVVPAASVGEVLGALEPLAGRIQAIGYAGAAGLRELADGAALLGVSRLSPVGTMAWPPADWRHEGRHVLLPLVNWTDWETNPEAR